MRKEVRIPQQGFTTEYVTIIEWKVSVGEHVDEGQTLCSTESDKAALDIESPHAGTVMEILKAEDEEVEIGEVIMIIE